MSNGRIRGTARAGVALAITALIGSSVAIGASAGGTAIAAQSKAAEAAIVSSSGQSLGSVKFVPIEGRTKMNVRARVEGVAPGFHGFHVHGVGLCDPNAVDATGNASPFFTAGGHYNPSGGVHGAHAGDMPPLYVAADGTGFLKFTTDGFKMKELLDADGAAVILHAGPDNLAHVPATTAGGDERYHSHVDDVFGPDTATKATGDAGARAGCGVIAKG